jgi:hypothetical protein
MTRLPRLKRAAVASLATFGLSAAVTVACNGNDGDSCVSTREYFASEVWTKVMSKSCINCHAPAGIAEEGGADFRLLPSSYPGFMDTNFDAVSEAGRQSYDDLSALLAKPSGKVEHGGGEVLKPDTEEYRIMESFVGQLAEPQECDDGDVTTLEGVVALGPGETLRKASLHLVGRLPTAEELRDVEEGGDEALADAVRAMLDEDAFHVRLHDILNDVLLTDRYIVYDGFAIDLLNPDDFPQAGAFWDGLDGQDDLRRKINRAVAREPIDLIRYIVKNDRPFKEILTADYTVVNPFSAQIYATKTEFKDPTDEFELKEAHLTVTRPEGNLKLAHAGVLSSPMFLNRFPTTPTNRNRHRARMVYKMFLATDILRIGERPIDPTASLTYNNPTRDDTKCNFCHKQIDPVAGAFQNFDDYDMEVLVPDREWYPEMFAPGFNGEDMPKSEFPEALPWFGQRAAEDPRFIIASVHLGFRALTGQEPLAYPDDTEDPTYAARLTAWQAQDSLFKAIGDAFVADEFNLKTILTMVIMSPYYRGISAEDELDEQAEVRLGAVGTARLSTPELLARKIEAVTGYRWVRPWDLSEQLATDYKILYGGIDSDSITQRLAHLNGIMAGVANRMANEMACGITAYDFTRAADKRTLFPKVTLEAVPLGPTGDEIPDAIADIKANIQYLHERILGEKLELEDPEIERTYQLFLDTWKDGTANLAAGEEDPWLSWWCQARVDPNTQVELPEAERLGEDPNYTVRAWMAVITYLLSDYSFLYE